MKLIRVAAAVLNQTPMDWDSNAANIRRAIDRARAERVSILCLPELCITGYGCEDEFQSRALQETALEVLRSLIPATRGMIVTLGLPVLHESSLFNAVCMCVDGRATGLVAKRHLASEGIHYEPRWFRPWSGPPAPFRFAGEALPLGDLFFDCGGVRIGFEICEDAWVGHRRGAALRDVGVDVILNPSASHFAIGKHEIRKRLVLEGARAFGVVYVYANQLGNESGRIIYDGGGLIAVAGHLAAAGPRLGFDDVYVTARTVDLDLARLVRTRAGGGAEDATPAPRPACVQAAFEFPACLPEPEAPALPAWEGGPHLPEEEFTRAVALGLLDYLRKSRARGYVVSLSGGADSSAVATLVAGMVHLAAAELGAGVLTRLPHRPGAPAPATIDPREIVRVVLATVYQGSCNSSPDSRQSARVLSAALGARYFEWEIDSIVGEYVTRMEASIGRPLTWDRDDITLQNIQARARGPGAWLVANVLDAILLATSDRSEAAVGYTTMDGDTCGGLCPVAGIDKVFLRRWLAWMQAAGPSGMGAVPQLAVACGLVPSPELRPRGAVPGGGVRSDAI
jgi:NAD+ synthase (glutamine-hydrolysing)